MGEAVGVPFESLTAFGWNEHWAHLLSEVPGVEQIAFNRQVGDEIDWRQGSQAYIASIRGWAADRDALRNTRARILEKLVLRYD